MLLLHLQKGAILTAGFPELVVGLDEAATEAGPELLAEAGRNLGEARWPIILLLSEVIASLSAPHGRRLRPRASRPPCRWG